MSKSDNIEKLIDAIKQMIDGSVQDAKPRSEYDDYGGMDRWEGESKLRKVLEDIVPEDPQPRRKT